jgi:hypothetical protein
LQIGQRGQQKLHPVRPYFGQTHVGIGAEVVGVEAIDRQQGIGGGGQGGQHGVIVQAQVMAQPVEEEHRAGKAVENGFT